MSSTPVIQIERAGFRYPNGVEALTGVDLEVGKGEIVSLVGPSGCGKSTLLDLVSGLRKPDSGTIRIDGKTNSNRRGRFSYMPQKDLLLPWRSAAGNAALLVEISGASKSDARERARNMLLQFGLEAFGAMYPAELSGGMRQRVALIRTFLPGRDVLLDEPFGALDAITRSGLQLWLMDLQVATGQSVLLVTHDVEEALLLSDRVYLFSPRPGHVEWAVDVVFKRPRSASLSTEPEFVRLKRELLNRLRSAMIEPVAGRVA